MMDAVEARGRIIWSADVEGPEVLLQRLETMPDLKIIKIDRAFETKYGLDVIDTLHDRGLQVFDDAKIVEVPTKMAEIAKGHLRRRPFMLNCMAHGVSNGDFADWSGEGKDERDGLKRFADACREANTMSVAVTVLTSKTDDICVAEFGTTAQEQVLDYIEFLVAAGFEGIVCSAREAAAVRSEFPGLKLVTPGLRLPGSDTRDQARVTTPGEAVTLGCDYLVVGSDLTSDESGRNFGRIVENIELALEA